MATIPQLQIPQMGAVSGGADFAPLAQLGNIYQKAQQDAANKQAFAVYQQTGDPSALLASGDMNLARLGVEARNHLDTLRQQGIENKRADINVGLAQAAGARAAAAERRTAAEDENTPYPYAKNPKFGQPGEPEYVDNIAPIKSAAELADRKAKAAAAELVPGTPEYKHFMATGNIPRLAGAVPEYGADLVSSLADRLEAGDASWKTGLARVPGLIQAVETEIAHRGTAAKANDPNARPAETVLQNRANQAGRAQEQRTLGSATASNTLYGNAAASTMQTAIEMSAKVPRTSYVPLNRLLQSGQSNLSNPDLAELRTATNTLVSDYAKAITPVGAPTDSARDHARELLDMATDHESFTRVVKLMHREIVNTHNAIEHTKKQLRSGQPGTVPSLDAPPPATRSLEDKAAADWAAANPGDPRAAAIKQRLGIQ